MSLLRLPESIQHSLARGEISARSAHEISRISDEMTQHRLAALARRGELTHQQLAGKVRQRRGKRKAARQGVNRTFFAENGWKIVVSSAKRGTYDDIELALTQVLEEVRHYLNNNVRL
jgi:hypothetical protein